MASNAPKRELPRFRDIVIELRKIAQHVEARGPTGTTLAAILNIGNPGNRGRLGPLHRLLRWWTRHHPGGDKLSHLADLLRLLENLFWKPVPDDPKQVAARLRLYADYLEEWIRAVRSKSDGPVPDKGLVCETGIRKAYTGLVKMDYPDLPPADAPLWVHLEWIQTTASSLQRYPAARQRLKNAIDAARICGRSPLLDPSVANEEQIHNRLYKDIVPLFREVMQKMPDFVDVGLKRVIETVHAVESNLERAGAAWEGIQLEARKRGAVIAEYAAWHIVHPQDLDRILQGAGTIPVQQMESAGHHDHADTVTQAVGDEVKGQNGNMPAFAQGTVVPMQWAPPATYKATDPWGERSLVVPPNTELPYVGDPTPIILDVEARTGTRLKDGGNPQRFLRIWHRFQERRDPHADISFAEYCARRHADTIDILRFQAAVGTDPSYHATTISELAEGDERTDGRPREAAKKGTVHNADFTMVKWYGTEYTFALGVQSLAVKALWNEWEKTGLGLHQETIRNAVDAERDNFRMDTTFRGHPALGTMIGRSGDGRYRLCPPDAQANPSKPKKASAGITSKSRRKRG